MKFNLITTIFRGVGSQMHSELIGSGFRFRSH